MAVRAIKKIYITTVQATGQLYLNVDRAAYHDVGRIQYIPGQLLVYRPDRKTLAGGVLKPIGRSTEIVAVGTGNDTDAGFVLRKGWPIYPPAPKPTEEQWEEMKRAELMALLKQDYEHDMQAEREGGTDDD